MEKGVMLEPGCAECSEIEDISHVIITCRRAKACWQIWEESSLLQKDNFHEEINYLFDNTSHEKIEEFCIIAWSIWSAKNTRIWRNISQNDESIFRTAMHMLHSWRHVKNLANQGRSSMEVPVAEINDTEEDREVA
ncbi:hypothetical protein ACFE04_002107 [Oxalis oulophora]